MSRLPFVLTLVVSGSLLSWLYVTQEAEGREKSRPASARAKARVFGYPDPRGILLELREQPSGACAAARFRGESPDFVVWDDGSVVFRTPTYDYRRGRVPLQQAQAWARTFQTYSLEGETVACENAADNPSRQDQIRLWGRAGDIGATLTICGLSASRAPHTEKCADCRPLRPLARMLAEIDRQRKEGDANETLTGLPVEVYLEWRSCGCRDHPEIAAVSKEWPLAGRTPMQMCGQRSLRFRLEDPADIRALSEAASRSAAVLDRGEIYTCFIRPLLEPRREGPLARR
jgi:hypothetical protein